MDRRSRLLMFVRSRGRHCCSPRLGGPRGWLRTSRPLEITSMASILPPGHRSAATVPGTVREPAAGGQGGVRPSLPARQTILFLSALLLLHATNPLAWGRFDSALWFPPTGLGLALIAWFGPRAALWL